MIKNAIKDAIYVRNREKTIRLLDFACQLQKAQSPDVITDVWPAYREGSTWDPVFVVLSHQTYPEDQYLGFKRHWRHCDLISREGCIVAYSDEVKDNPLSFEDMENMRKLIRAADLLKFHSKVTVTNACPCRSRNGGRDISIEKCIVIYTSVKGFIPFDEQPFPKTVFGIPVDVREANVTLGGKTYKANCEHDSSYRIREPNVLNNSSPVSANNVLTTSLKTFENNTTDNRQMVGKKLRLQRKRKPYTVPKLTRQPDLLQKPMRQQLLETATKISLNSACNSSHGDCKTGYARGDLEYLFPYPEFFQRNPTKAFGNNENPVECSSMETNEVSHNIYKVVMSVTHYDWTTVSILNDGYK